MAATIEKVMKSDPFDIEFRILTRDGEERAVRSQGELSRDAAGRPLAIFGVQHDITEIKRAHEQLRRSHTDLAALNQRLKDTAAESRRLAHNAVLANRHGEYLWKIADAPNSAAAFFSTNLRVTASMTQGTTSLVRAEVRQTMIPKTPEVLVWDADGNLLQDGLWTNTWNAENRLIVRETTSGVPDAQKRRVEYRHDWMGRLTERKAMSVWNGDGYATTSSTFYVWNGWLTIAEITSSVTNYLTYGADVGGGLQTAGGVGGLVFVSLSGTNCLPIFNGNGDVMGLVYADSGSVAAEYDYSPSGETLKTQGALATANHFRFSTKLFDDTGLLVYPLRPYSPRHHCFLSRDPIEEYGGINLHGLCANDWMNAVDPLGLLVDVAGGVAGVGTLAGAGSATATAGGGAGSVTVTVVGGGVGTAAGGGALLAGGIVAGILVDVGLVGYDAYLLYDTIQLNRDTAARTALTLEMQSQLAELAETVDLP